MSGEQGVRVWWIVMVVAAVCLVALIFSGILDAATAIRPIR